MELNTDSQSFNKRFSDKSDLPKDQVDLYDLNAGVLKLLSEMCKGKSPKHLLDEHLGIRSDDKGRFDAEKMKLTFPYLPEEAYQEKTENPYAHFVNLKSIYLLEKAIGKIAVIRNKIKATWRDNTEHIRFAYMESGNEDSEKLLRDIHPHDFEKVVTFVKNSLQASLQELTGRKSFALVKNFYYFLVSGGTGFMPSFLKTSSSVFPATYSPSLKRPYSFRSMPCSMAVRRIITLNSLLPVK